MYLPFLQYSLLSNAHTHTQYSTDRLTEDAISIAVATKENLSNQRSVFSGTTGRMQAIASILIDN